MLSIFPVLLTLSAHFARSDDFSSKHPSQDFQPVDLGYATHIPTYINTTASGIRVAAYNNIRFAQPPTGPLRFRKPVVPPSKQEGVQNGSAPFAYTDCIIGVPSIVPFPGINGTAWGREDCLFLNVLVPEGIKKGDSVPVLHWLYGSAFTFGSKDWGGSPLGLFDGVKNSNGKFIYVASNYRLGVTGWMASPGEDMDPNIGLHDAVTALEWTQQYVSKFGGNPNQVTVMGISAGAALINLMVTGNGGQGGLPFHQAISFSPAIPPRRNVTTRRQDLYEEVLKSMNCSTLACLRSMPEDVIRRANLHLVSDLSSTGGGGAFGPGIGFAPVVDDEFVPDLPSTLLKQGRYHKSLKQIIVANMANEGLGNSRDDNMPQAFPALVRGMLPNASDDIISQIQAHYPYPPDLPQKVAWDWSTDIVFACNAFSLAKAFGDKARRYVMSIPPATHGLDFNYFFHVDNTTTPVANTDIAHQLQSFIRQFLYEGTHPRHLTKHRETRGNESNNLKSLDQWPHYGAASRIFDISLDGVRVERDAWDSEEHCLSLERFIDDPSNGA